MAYIRSTEGMESLDQRIVVILAIRTVGGCERDQKMLMGFVRRQTGELLLIQIAEGTNRQHTPHLVPTPHNTRQKRLQEELEQ